MKIVTPGKLILSGEHAVVYGKPALAMAVNRYVTVTITSHVASEIVLALSDFSYEARWNDATLQHLKNHLKDQYNKFLRNEMKIQDVLKHPAELIQFTTSLCLDTLNEPLKEGMKINLQSTIPVGCGMGSSAATILSVLCAIAHHLQKNISSETLLQLGLQAENMQHGQSSGFDLQIAFNGGCLYKKDGELFSRATPMFPFYLVNTGKPKTSTGECVVSAAPHFKKTTIGNDFEEVTNAFDRALENNALHDVMEIIHANHQLLMKIGVLPEKVKSFIADVEKSSSAAKICGAGAVTGECAGVVLVVSENESDISRLCERYGYDMLPIKGEPRGLHVI